MALGIDDKVIDWSLKLVQKNRVDFSDWVDETIHEWFEEYWLELFVRCESKKIVNISMMVNVS